MPIYAFARATKRHDLKDHKITQSGFTVYHQHFSLPMVTITVFNIPIDTLLHLSESQTQQEAQVWHSLEKVKGYSNIPS